MFNWIRKSVKNAFLAGINDAIAEIRGDAPDPAETVLRLDAPVSTAPALPAAEEPTRRNGKKVAS